MLNNQSWKHSNKHNSIILLILISLFILGCYGDPVIFYQPKDWAKEENPWFRKSFGELDLKINEIGGITINDHLTPEIIIHNRSKSTFVLERAILSAGGRKYSASSFGEKAWDVVPPNETRRLALEFEFQKPIDGVLKDPVEIILVLKSGNDSTKILIPFVERK